MPNQTSSSPLAGEQNYMERIKLVAKQVIELPLRLLDIVAELYSWALSKIRPNLGYLWIDLQTQKISQRIRNVAHSSGNKTNPLKFHTPNHLCEIRATTFSTKEPETLAWIDEYGGQGAFFDIGANVGLYSVYFGATKPGNVYSFEPSVFNLALLVKNLNANGLEKKVKIVSTPLTETNQFADFTLSSTQEGGALSAFGVGYGYDGKPLTRVSSYQTLGFSLDFLLSSGLLGEHPSMIKIDVDGIEHLILRGALKTLANPICRTVLLEIPDDFSEQAEEVSRILMDSGFTQTNKRDPAVPNDLSVSSGFNQIWAKKSQL